MSTGAVVEDLGAARRRWATRRMSRRLRAKLTAISMSMDTRSGFGEAGWPPHSRPRYVAMMSRALDASSSRVRCSWETSRGQSGDRSASLSNRVAALVYLDARTVAFDNGEVTTFETLGGWFPAASAPDEADLATFDACVGTTRRFGISTRGDTAFAAFDHAGGRVGPPHPFPAVRARRR